MSAGRGGVAQSPPSRHAAQGGECDGGIEGAEDAIAIATNIQSVALHVGALRELQAEYSSALSQPSMTDAVRAEVLARVKTPETLVRIRPILQKLFDGKIDAQTSQEQMDIMLNCILDALTMDLPLTTLISMIGRMLMKVFYNNNEFRVALALSFVGSASYATWFTGMSQIVDLGQDMVILILSAMAQCVHLVNNPEEYAMQFKNILGVPIVGLLGTSMRWLVPSAGAAFSMSNVYLLGWFYGPQQIPPAADLQDAVAAHAAAQAAEQAAAGGAAMMGVPVIFNPVPADAAGAAAVPAGAAAEAADARYPLFRVMRAELKRGGRALGNGVLQYLRRLHGFAGQIKSTRPGQLGIPADTLNRKINMFCIAGFTDLFDRLNTQAVQVEMPQDLLYATMLLSACFSSAILRGSDGEAAEEIFLLAQRIKPHVI